VLQAPQTGRAIRVIETMPEFTGGRRNAVSFVQRLKITLGVSVCAHVFRADSKAGRLFMRISTAWVRARPALV